MSNTVYTREQVIKAIDGSAGIISAIAARLGCGWGTAQKLIGRWVETQEAFKAEREKILDLAESKIVESIRNGDTQDAKWVLARLGKARGWGDQVAVTGENGGPLEIKVTYVNSGGEND